MTRKHNPKPGPDRRSGLVGPIQHGIYAKYFDDLENSELAEIGEGIDEELKALRVSAARLFGRASEDVRDWKSEMQLLETFGRQCISIAALVRTRKVISDVTGRIEEEIKQGFVDASDQWSIFNDRKL